jgi:transcriptional regulator with XRE-family HTH domain
MKDKKKVAKPDVAVSRRPAKRSLLVRIFAERLTSKNMILSDLARSGHVSISALSNIFSGNRLPSDEVLYLIAKELKFPRHEIAELLLYLAQERTSGSSREIWSEMLRTFQSGEKQGFRKTNLGNHDQSGSFIPIYKSVRPGLKPGDVRGTQIGIFPYWEEKAREGAFGLLVPDDSMDGPPGHLKVSGLAIFERYESMDIPIGKVACVHLPGDSVCRIRRISRDRLGNIVFQPDNKRYERVSVPFSRKKKIFYALLAGFWMFSL